MGECGPRIYSCSNCRCHVAEHDDIISKSFTSNSTRRVATPCKALSQGPRVMQGRIDSRERGQISHRRRMSLKPTAAASLLQSVWSCPVMEFVKYKNRKFGVMTYLHRIFGYTSKLSENSHFHGRNGRAYLFQTVVNITVGPKEDRQLITGLHTVADIQCSECQEVLGWKYEKAYDEAQKYKEGKYILEKAKVMKEDW